MNIQEYDIMNDLIKNSYSNQRKLAEHLNYSLGKVNNSLKKLIKEQYIDNNMQLSEKGLSEFQYRKPQNAIILAAGYGMRMVPINAEIPKGLLEVHNEPLIERIIKQLWEVNIKEIEIVIGFMKEQYEYLIDKYHVNLVFNKHYSSRNNLYSLYCAADKIGNTYIIPCDIWCKENPFSRQEWYSWYMVTNQESEDSFVRINRKRELVNIKKNEIGNRMIGIAYILEEDSQILKRTIQNYITKKKYNHAFWETALFEEEKITVGAKKVKDTEVFEVNTYEELRELDEDSNQLKSDVMVLISKVLDCDIDDIRNIHSLKKGMTNRSFKFTCKNEGYIMRIPGEGTDKMINRKNEYRVYQVLADREITDPVLYISPDNGYKITKFISDTRVCNIKDTGDVAACMLYLKNFHNLNLQVNHTFDIFEQIEFYEKLRKGKPSVYRDYDQTKEKIYKLKEYIDRQSKQIALTHIDAVSDNFLISKERIYLIDWEYAGMQDVHVDIAMFAIYAMYGREEVDKLIKYYFVNDPDESIRTKIYCYIAVCGFLWSNWCEYKRMCGIEFGEYSLRQYRFAKEYYEIAKERIK